MNFIEQKDGEFIKYLIRLNETALMELRNTIISRCGEITHYCYESEVSPDLEKLYFVKNFKQTFVKDYEYDHFYDWGKQKIFRYEYDLYAPTTLTLLIDRLFDDDSSAILELRNPQVEESIQSKLSTQLQEKKKQIITLLTDTTVVDINRLNQFKEELNALQEKQKLNYHRSSDLEYYSQVLSYIEMIEIVRIQEGRITSINSLLDEVYQSIAEIQEFFGDNEGKKMTIATYQKTIGKLVES